MQEKLDHQHFMKRALLLAKRASELGEVPVGALVVFEGKLISQAYNLRETKNNPLAHAELLAINRASKILNSWRLIGCTLYVSLEPCVMCAGAIINSRVDRLVYGAQDPKGGAVESLYQIVRDQRLNHRPELIKGVMAEECGTLLTEFFKKLRNQKKSRP